MSAVQIVAPTDAQLDYIANLCFERGWAFPQSIHSKTEASEIIAAILNGSYNSMRYAMQTEPADDEVPF